MQKSEITKRILSKKIFKRWKRYKSKEEEKGEKRED
jgi:hypothetical protein